MILTNLLKGSYQLLILKLLLSDPFSTAGFIKIIMTEFNNSQSFFFFLAGVLFYHPPF